MFDALCVETVTVSNVKVEEKGRKAIFRNPLNTAHDKIQMDGCVVRNSTAADWVVTKTEVGTIIVELKGKDVEHGAQQVEATARLLKQMEYPVVQLAALIVSTSYPKASSTIQKAQQRFFRNFGGPLHVVTRNDSFDFERVLRADGPR
ncbi:hypothetical protein [Rhizobium leguminosarum]|uniref:Uncharacterized protein n=1 Tax=Rhizobium leguminosarum TaxID=384 RepID=A0A7W9ZPB6_RHILE|nr:hypothetical protein [Rhizobium leguminosarum]MBB6219990.1 hypothetical protein [Rhizobium leguminosarum]